MFVKLMTHDGGEKVYQCTHIAVTDYSRTATLKDENGNSLSGGHTGLDIEVCPLGITINLPRDGVAVYTTNDRGDTLHKYTWPRKGQAISPIP